MTWWKQIMGPKAASGSVAKNRLKMVLSHDRGDNLSPGLIEEIRDDIIEAITKRLSLDRDNVVVHVQNSGREQRLIAEIPLALETPRRRSR